MKTTITAKKMQIPQNFTEHAETRIAQRLGKFFGDEADAKIVMSEIKNKIVLELTVKYNSMIYRAERSAEDKAVALDDAIDKIIRQIRKNKTRVEKKLNVEEAILQMNLLSHEFFMFLNADTGVINVVYKRDDGNYALLEPDND